MILTRAPLRLTLAGGGTDFPSFYARNGGMVASAAITRYVYIALNRPPLSAEYAVRYSTAEHVRAAADIQHPILREALAKTDPGVEIASLADVPAGTGLGSSGAFTVALLKALKPHMPTRWLAEEACAIEIDRLGRPVGEQDAYVAAYGGCRVYRWHRSGAVAIDPLDLGPLASRLCLFFTGLIRDADGVLAAQHDAHDNLTETYQHGCEQVEMLEAKDWDAYGASLSAHWERKRARAPGMSTPDIDAAYETGMAAGALGGKLVGAGGGGFLCFYTHTPTALRDALSLPELTFDFDMQGATCISS